MSVQINNQNFTSLGRMFAKQNVPAVYGRQQFAGADEPERAIERVDQVSLSGMAPKPLTASLFQEAVDTGRMLSSGEPLPEGRMDRLREDRVLSAMSALALLGEDGENGLTFSWPGGLPSPTREEMSTARKRLSQRLEFDEAAGDPDEIQYDRMELLKRLRESDKAGAARAAAQSAS
jgi:hypothetical protein